MGDRKGFARGEPLILEVNPVVSVSDRVVVFSTLVVKLSLAIAVILAHPKCVPANKLTPRRWLHQPYWEVWKLPSKKLAAATCEADALCFVSTALQGP